MVSQTDKVKCSRIMGKARVPPKKVITVPRLELQAAVVSVRIAQHIRHEINCDDDGQYRMYVANKVQAIKDYAEPDQWHYINPATTQRTLPHARVEHLRT